MPCTQLRLRGRIVTVLPIDLSRHIQFVLHWCFKLIGHYFEPHIGTGSGIALPPNSGAGSKPRSNARKVRFWTATHTDLAFVCFRAIPEIA